MDDDVKHQSPESSRPPTAQKVLRRVPGSFDDDGISPLKDTFDDIQPLPQLLSTATNTLVTENKPPLPPSFPPVAESSFLEGPSLFDNKHSDSQAEIAVRAHLQDIESSFNAPLSPIPASNNGIDDTYLFDSPSKKPTLQAPLEQLPAANRAA